MDAEPLAGVAIMFVGAEGSWIITNEGEAIDNKDVPDALLAVRVKL